MSAMSNYLEKEVLDHVLGTGSFTMPSTVKIGLSTQSFADTATGTELSGNGYARVDISFSAATTSGYNVSTATTSGTVTFPTATGSWGSVAYFGIFDAATSGNLLVHGAFAAAKTIASGDIFRIDAGDLTITAA